MKLTLENYFSKKAMFEYMSTSQFKAFEKCEAEAIYNLNADVNVVKDAFTEGHLFEALIEGGEQEQLFYAQHPEMISGTGKSKGQLKSNFKKIVGSAEAFKKQPEFVKIYNRCEKQVILTGVINGVKYKAAVDLIDIENGEIYDTKCMKDFKKVYSETARCYAPWMYAYGYHYQAAIYLELAKQMFGKEFTFNLLAVTKEENPDVFYGGFTQETVNNALEIIKEFSPLYQDIKNGVAMAERCEHCNYCKESKIITGPEIIEVW